jgi:hypothetical protein
MSILIPILGVALTAGVALGLLPKERGRSFANSVIGTHRGSVTRLTDAAVSIRYLLGTQGSDASHVAVCGASTVPLGVIADEASDAGEEVAVELLGAAGSTVRMVAGGAVPVGSLVYTAANGLVTTLSAAAGTYYCVGIALSAATASGEVIEVDPCVAHKITVS